MPVPPAELSLCTVQPCAGPRLVPVSPADFSLHCSAVRWSKKGASLAATLLSRALVQDWCQLRRPIFRCNAQPCAGPRLVPVTPLHRSCSCALVQVWCQLRQPKFATRMFCSPCSADLPRAIAAHYSQRNVTRWGFRVCSRCSFANLQARCVCCGPCAGVEASCVSRAPQLPFAAIVCCVPDMRRVNAFVLLLCKFLSALNFAKLTCLRIVLGFVGVMGFSSPKGIVGVHNT